MKKFVLVAAFATLAACGGADSEERASIDPAETAAPATSAGPADPAIENVEGTYEMTAEDGTVMTRTIERDGTYTTRIGDTVGEAGTVRIDGDAICYDPEGPPPEVCWHSGETAEDGSFQATRGTKTMRVRLID